MKKKRVLYFAYGSNMCVSRIYERIGKVKLVGAYSIKGYELAFNCGWRQGSYGNMKENPYGTIEGVLYELTEEQIATLDRYECYPRNYDKSYFYDQGKDAIIFAYIATPWFVLRENEFAKPDIFYLNYLIKGCEEFNLHTTLDFLINYKKDNYKKIIIKNSGKIKKFKQGKFAGSGKTSYGVQQGHVTIL